MIEVEKLKTIFEILCALVEVLEIEKKEERILELALNLYDVIDPFPSLDLDDAVVEAIMRWLLSICSSKDSNPS